MFFRKKAKIDDSHKEENINNDAVNADDDVLNEDKGEQKNKGKNVLKNTKNLGGDTLSVVVLEESEDREEFLKEYPNLKKFEKYKFGDENFFVSASSEKRDISYYQKTFIYEYILICMYIKEMRYTNAFYLDGDKFISFESYDKFIKIKEHKYEKSIELEDFAEIVFNGSSNHRIDLSIDEIRKEFGKNEYKQLVILGLAVLFLLTALYYAFGSTEKKKNKVAPPKPIPNLLTRVEKQHLYRLASIDFMNNVTNEINMYKINKYTQKLRRVISVTFGQKTDVPPAEPVLTQNKEWKYPQGKPKRGGVSYQVQKTSQRNFIGVDYKLSGEDLYAKDTRDTILKIETSLEKNKDDIKKLVFSQECLQKAIHLKGVTTPIKRTSGDVDIKIEKVAPSEIVRNFLKIIKECPVYIDKAVVSNGKFSMDFVMYKTREGLK